MEDSGFLSQLANLIGSPEAALRLIISLLLGYPIAFVHRKYLYGKSPNLQHLYFIGCGISLCFFNYGWDVIHSFGSIAVTYIVLKLFGGGLISLLVVFIYTMGHLLVGYWTTATSTYDIKWTMPQCVLTLRLIGLAFNVYDGQQPRDELSKENTNVALPTVPTVLEVFAHSYFPSSFLVGPQLPLKRYVDFVQLKLEKKVCKHLSAYAMGQSIEGIIQNLPRGFCWKACGNDEKLTSFTFERANPKQLPKSFEPGMKRFALGIMYLIIYQMGSFFVYDDFFLSEEYKILPLWKQFFFLGLWSRITLYKYISCWLITEGSCIIMGLTYNGVDEKGVTKWDGCSNVKLGIFESCTRMNHYIESFNINTNNWVAQYIYKRLKFLNNKMLSHIGALLFLAIWHGFHSGYYATFFFEFIVITAEKNVISLLEMRPAVVNSLTKPSVYPIVYIILRMYTFVVMGYAMIPFILLKYRRYLPVFKQFYFSIHIICLSILILNPFLRKWMKGKQKNSEASVSSSSPRKSKVQVRRQSTKTKEN